MAAANPRTVVVLDTGGPVLMPWLDQVAGVLEAWYPGRGGRQRRGGRAATATPTRPDGCRSRSRRASPTRPANTPAQYPGVNGVATYSEGLDVGYRHYDASGIEPLFPFGYGLSYTTFRLDHLDVESRSGGVRSAST